MLEDTAKTKYSKSHFLRGMVWTSWGNVIAIATGIITVVLASRILNKEELGVYFLILMLGNFVSVVGDFGLRTTSIKFLSSAHGEEKTHIANSLLSMQFLQIVFIGVILVPILIVLKKFWTSELFGASVWYVIPFAVFQMVNNALSTAFVGYHKFKTFSMLIICLAVLRMVMSVTLLLLGYKLDGLMWSLIFSTFLSCIIIWQVLPFNFTLTFNLLRIRQLLKFGSWVYGSSVISIVMARAAEVILVTCAGPAVIAIYGNAMRIPNLLLRLFESIRPIILSYVSIEQKNYQQATINSIRILSGLLSVFAAFLITFGEQLTILLFSEKYLESVPILRVLAFWISISIVNYFLVLSLIGANQVRRMFFVSLTQFAVTIVTYLALIPKYGAMGAAVSMTIVAGICDIVSIAMFAGRKVKVAIGLILAMSRSAIPLFIYLMIFRFFDFSMVGAIVLLTSFLVVLRLLNALTIKDIKMLYLHTFYKRVT